MITTLKLNYIIWQKKLLEAHVKLIFLKVFNVMKCQKDICVS